MNANLNQGPSWCACFVPFAKWHTRYCNITWYYIYTLYISGAFTLTFCWQSFVSSSIGDLIWSSCWCPGLSVLEAISNHIAVLLCNDNLYCSCCLQWIGPVVSQCQVSNDATEHIFRLLWRCLGEIRPETSKTWLSKAWWTGMNPACPWSTYAAASEPNDVDLMQRWFCCLWLTYTCMYITCPFFTMPPWLLVKALPTVSILHDSHCCWGTYPVTVRYEGQAQVESTDSSHQNSESWSLEAAGLVMCWCSVECGTCAFHLPVWSCWTTQWAHELVHPEESMISPKLDVCRGCVQRESHRSSSCWNCWCGGLGENPAPLEREALVLAVGWVIAS